jgi:hypothetical protein
MAAPLQIRAIQAPLEARRGAVELARRAQAKGYTAYGRLEFRGTGGATFEVKFPVWFIEAPQMAFGAELTGNPVIDPTNYPRVNVLVRGWRTIRRDGRDYYVGAEFVVAVGGPSDITGIAHWQCQGTALTNPIVGGSV